MAHGQGHHYVINHKETRHGRPGADLNATEGGACVHVQNALTKAPPMDLIIDLGVLEANVSTQHVDLNLSELEGRKSHSDPNVVSSK
jgi:hypothetical protein